MQIKHWMSILQASVVRVKFDCSRGESRVSRMEGHTSYCLANCGQFSYVSNKARLAQRRGGAETQRRDRAFSGMNLDASLRVWRSLRERTKTVSRRDAEAQRRRERRQYDHEESDGFNGRV